MDQKKLFLLSVSFLLGALFADRANAVNDFFASGFPAATVTNLKWTIDTTSVSTTYMNAYIDPGSKKWNGVSSKVNVVKGTATDYNIRFFVAGDPNASVVGRTFPYCAAGNGPVCNDTTQTYTAARIYMYESNMVGQGFTTERRIACAAHELGHALSMKHTFVGAAPPSTPSLMAEILPQVSTVENLDKANLRGRWGS